METDDKHIRDRVRENTSETRNREIDRELLESIEKYRHLPVTEINHRLEELQKEWDIERALEVNAASVSLIGVVLGALVDRKWFILSGVVAGSLLLHAIQGWCPPLPMLRKSGFRTRQEIDNEIYALKVLRGDFDLILSTTGPAEVLRTLRS